MISFGDEYLSTTGMLTSGALKVTGLDCTANANGGTLTAGAGGMVSCADDEGGAVEADSLDFSDFADSLTLDASTSLNLGANAADLNIDAGTLYVDSSANRIGIGNSLPAEALDITGNMHASGTLSSGNSITINGATDTITASGGTIGFDDDNLTTTGITTTNALTIAGLDCTANANGGTLSAGAGGVVSCAEDDAGSGGDDLGDHVADQNLQLNGNYLSGDGGSEGVWVAGSGDVGIGTTSPGERLQVSGAVVLADSTAAVPVAGTVRWNPSSVDFEGHDGAGWISLTGAGVNTPPLWCPDGGFIPVTVDYCIQAAEFASAATYQGAEAVCTAMDPVASRIRLCTYDEWFYACQIQDTLDPVPAGMVNNWEWVDDPAFDGGGPGDLRRVAGNTACNITTTYAATNTFTYRCCFDRK